MCDTILAIAASTRAGGTLFGKNSDRQRNEAQIVERHLGGERARGSLLDCTYITIPQAPRTSTILICRPHWGWGAEMGTNEHGVVIGNEAVHARAVAAATHPALTGMDLLRLGLERSQTAAEAVDVITSLLEQHGQGGDCGHIAPSFYHNAFLIADVDQGFVLETVGRDWLVERVSETRAISNRYSIRRSPDRVSPGVEALVGEHVGSGGYASALADTDREHIGHAQEREARGQALLDRHAGRLDPYTLMQILRDHGDRADWHPESADTRTLCMHAQGHDSNGQTVGSLICDVRRDQAVHWVTATSAPCLSIFKPLFVDLPVPHHGRLPGHFYDASSLWWAHERLHRTALASNFQDILSIIVCERDNLEERFRDRVNDCDAHDREGRQRIVSDCWNEALKMEAHWATRLAGQARFSSSPFGAAWSKMSQIAGVAQG